MPESLNQKDLQEYKGYNILCIGEGGGDMGPSDNSIRDSYGSVAEKVRKGASYLSLEKLAGAPYFMPKKTPEQRREAYWARAKRENLDRQFILGTANELPFKDGSINEIWIENVFSDPSSPLSTESIGEAARVLKKGGYLYLIHTITPDFAYPLKDFDFERYGLIKHVLEGEALKAFLLEQDYDYVEIVMRDQRTSRKPFAIVCQKDSS